MAHFDLSVRTTLTVRFRHTLGVTDEDERRKSIDWLPDAERRWVSDHPGVLDEIYAAFYASGEWPEPVQLQRELRGRARNIEFSSAISEMPRTLGYREWSPPRMQLTLFGIGCCRSAKPLLERLVEVVQLALARFDTAALPNRLTRADVDSHLGLQPIEADRLSKLVVQDGFFLGGGNANVEEWDQSIDEHVIRFDGIEGADELLQRLARLRGLGSPPAVIDGDSSRARRQSSVTRRAGNALSPQHPIGYVVGGVVIVVVGGLMLWLFGFSPR